MISKLSCCDENRKPIPARVLEDNWTGLARLGIHRSYYPATMKQSKKKIFELNVVYATLRSRSDGAGTYLDITRFGLLDHPRYGIGERFCLVTDKCFVSDNILEVALSTLIA